MVRGLDYYARTTFEITSLALGAQSAVAAGGRYDGLIKELGGPKLSGMGFAIGMERLSLLIGDLQKIEEEPILFVAAMGEKACVIAARIAHRVRLAGTPAEIDYEGHSLKSQMRRAGKIGASLVLIMGDDELTRNSVTMRDMKSSRQWAVDFNDDIEALIRRIGEEMGRFV
jgi:histidyl-tRNA synthetase